MQSESELPRLQLRVTAGRERQIERGAYCQHLPTGLIRLEDGRVVTDPDVQIQRTVVLVFTRFAELGSCHTVSPHTVVECRTAERPDRMAHAPSNYNDAVRRSIIPLVLPRALVPLAGRFGPPAPTAGCTRRWSPCPAHSAPPPAHRAPR